MAVTRRRLPTIISLLSEAYILIQVCTVEPGYLYHYRWRAVVSEPQMRDATEEIPGASSVMKVITGCCGDCVSEYRSNDDAA